MRNWTVVCGILLVTFIAGCGYSLPLPLQQQVDVMGAQMNDLYGVVTAIKAGVKTDEVDASAADMAEKRYGELVQAHNDWRAQVKKVITTEMQNFANNDDYKNAVTKLDNASKGFEDATEAAMGVPAEVPDWADEAKKLIDLAYNERKLKRAADIIFKELTMKSWDDIEG